jgi:hypothetical protein
MLSRSEAAAERERRRQHDRNNPLHLRPMVHEVPYEHLRYSLREKRARWLDLYWELFFHDFHRRKPRAKEIV